MATAGSNDAWVDDAGKAVTRDDNMENGQTSDMDLVAVKNEEGIVAKISDLLANSIPPQNSVDIHDLRKTGLAQFIAFGFIATYIIVLINSSVTGYAQLRNENFLSLDIFGGECEEVALDITNIYESDSKGIWDTDSGYDATQSMYALDMRGTTVTNTEYRAIMKKFQEGLQKQSEMSVKRDLSYNMLALASYNLADVEGQMSFFTNARAEKVFGSTIFDSAITDVTGSCYLEPDAYFDADSATLQFDLKLEDPADEDYVPCSQLTLDDFEETNGNIPNVAKVKFDIRSLATAVAINVGMTDIKKDLSKIIAPKGYFDSNDYVFDPNYYPKGAARYVDPFYSNMAPIVCFDGPNFGNSSFCLLEGTNNVFYYPMITQYGHWDEEKRCTCGDSGTIFDEGMKKYCSEADFLVSLVYVSKSKNESIVDFAMSISQLRHNDPVNGDLEIAALFHSAQYRSIAGTDLEIEAAFDALCPECTMFTVEFWGSSTSTMNARGTPIYSMYQDDKMIACSNGLYRPEAIEPLTTRPPITLVETYYTCKLNVTVAATRAVGIAAGSAALYAGIVLQFLLMVVITSYNLKSKEKIPKPATKKKNIEDDVAMLKASNNKFKEEMRVLRSMIEKSNK